MLFINIVYIQSAGKQSLYSLFFLYIHIFFFFYIVLNDEFFACPCRLLWKHSTTSGYIIIFSFFSLLLYSLYTARMETTKTGSGSCCVYIKVYTKMELLLYTFRVIIFIIPTFFFSSYFHSFLEFFFLLELV